MVRYLYVTRMSFVKAISSYLKILQGGVLSTVILTVKGQQCYEDKRIVALVNSSFSDNKQTFLHSFVKRGEPFFFLSSLKSCHETSF